MSDTKKPAKRTPADKTAKVFSDDERDAIKNRAAEVKAAGARARPRTRKRPCSRRSTR